MELCKECGHLMAKHSKHVGCMNYDDDYCPCKVKPKKINDKERE